MTTFQTLFQAGNSLLREAHTLRRTELLRTAHANLTCQRTLGAIGYAVKRSDAAAARGSYDMAFDYLDAVEAMIERR